VVAKNVNYPWSPPKDVHDYGTRSAKRVKIGRIGFRMLKASGLKTGVLKLNTYRSPTKDVHGYGTGLAKTVKIGRRGRTMLKASGLDTGVLKFEN
jgi:hypothetical protein